jgi:NAD(P)-dependent dehydrogenase (short-subunit alcohol dehydrogenase family)
MLHAPWLAAATMLLSLSHIPLTYREARRLLTTPLPSSRMNEPKASAGGRARRVCIVTGANSGIGKATAMALASAGATVVMVCRNRERGEKAAQEVVGRTGNTNVHVELADLSVQAAIRALAQSLSARFPQVDVLVHAAGATFFERRLSVDGIEMNWAVNVLAPFLLTRLLLPVLKAGAPSRVVILTGRYSPKVALMFDDLQLGRDFSPWTAARQATLAKILLTAELGRRVPASSVSANCVYPGPVRTELQTKLPWHYRLLVLPIRLFFQSPSQGARGPVFVASASEMEQVSGGYFERARQVHLAPEAVDPHNGRRLWEIAETMTNKPPAFAS